MFNTIVSNSIMIIVRQTVVMFVKPAYSKYSEWIKFNSRIGYILVTVYCTALDIALDTALDIFIIIIIIIK